MKNRIAKLMSLIMAICFIVSMMTACAAQPEVQTPAAAEQQSVTVETPTAEVEEVPEKHDPVDIFIGGGPNSGVFYIVGAAMATVINDNSEWLVGNVESTGASAENMLLTNGGETDFGFTSSDILYCSSRGEREYADGDKYENLQLAMVGYSAPFHIVVRADSDIQTVADLKGKKIAANTGITSTYQAPAILAAYGITTDDYTSLPLGPADCRQALQDGIADAIIINLGVPAAQITDLSTNIDVRFLDLADGVEKICTDNPYFFEDVIPAGSYNGQDEDVVTVTLRIMLATNKDVPEDVVYEFCDIIYNHNEELGLIHPSAAAFTPEMTEANLMIDLHPGAARWLEDNK